MMTTNKQGFTTHTICPNCGMTHIYGKTIKRYVIQVIPSPYHCEGDEIMMWGIPTVFSRVRRREPAKTKIVNHLQRAWVFMRGDKQKEIISYAASGTELDAQFHRVEHPLDVCAMRLREAYRQTKFTPQELEDGEVSHAGLSHYLNVCSSIRDGKHRKDKDNPTYTEAKDESALYDRAVEHAQNQGRQLKKRAARALPPRRERLGCLVTETEGIWTVTESFLPEIGIHEFTAINEVPIADNYEENRED